MNKLRDYFNKLNIYSRLTFLIGLLTSIPLVVLFFYPQDRQYFMAFALPVLIAWLLALILGFVPTDKTLATRRLTLHHSSLPVLYAWLTAFIIGALPFFLSGKLDFIRSLFESVSGWTTTGFALLEADQLPKILLFHRSFMQYCGGLGFLLMIVLLTQGKHAMAFYSAEGHSEKLLPSLRRSVRTIYFIYNTFLFTGIILYMIFGMQPFDAICHAMAALATAGHTSQVGGINYYQSFGIELVTISLMLLGSSSFTLLLFAFKGQLKRIFKVTEVKLMLSLIGCSTLFIAVVLLLNKQFQLIPAIWQAFFAVVSFLSTTGYSLSNYFTWPILTLVVFFSLMFIGGGSGSTAGGIKIHRFYLLVRGCWLNLRDKTHPSHQLSVPYYQTIQGKTEITTELSVDTFNFFLIFLFTLLSGGVVLTITANSSLPVGIFEFASALTTTGISSGLTAYSANTATLIVQMIGMFLGRLEIIVVLIGLYSFFPAIKHLLKKNKP